MQVITRNKVVPNLRFSNFDGEWEVKPINDVCKLKAGKFVSASKISKEQESTNTISDDDIFNKISD